MSKRTIYFNNYCGFDQAAVTEDGKLIEFNFEKRSGGAVVGNIYKGRVETVLPGMQAAFVNCGLERNCYVSAEDVIPDALGCGADGVEAAFPELKEGDEILVQIIKPPVGKKGARVTTHPSYVGNSLIYMPDVHFVGVSRKIGDKELRGSLVYSVKKLIGESEGAIVRTAAPYQKREQIVSELKYLKNLHAGVLQSFERAETGDLLYTDAALPIRVMRDVLAADIEKIVVGTEALRQAVTGLMDLFPAESRRPVILHEGKRDMLEEAGISQQIDELCSPKVGLDNGGYLVIEKTEALTVIDVNTGSFTGDDSLEQTVYYTNVLAAREIARQVRLRNIGGIVIVDFIDMQKSAHSKAIVQELERALAADKVKCQVSPMSRLGLVEFTRKRSGNNPLSLLVRPCVRCSGSGLRKTADYVIFCIRAQILKLASEGKTTVRLDLCADVVTKLFDRTEILEDIKSRCKKLQVYAVPHKSFAIEQMNIRCKGDENFSLPENPIKLI
ncbi:MAG: Rne/Rng family ribonuclease [Clostridia bacterium]|nr:Rne/Rng family ribonuclease [Clostridia bacterium]